MILFLLGIREFNASFPHNRFHVNQFKQELAFSVIHHRYVLYQDLELDRYANCETVYTAPSIH